MRPLPLLTVGVVLGAYAWPFLQPTRLASAFSAGFLLLLGLRSRPGLAAAGLCLGLALPGRTEVGPALRGELSLRGVVQAVEGASFVLDLTGIGPEPRPIRGPIRVRSRDRVVPGDRVVVLGEAAPLDPTHLPGAADPSVDAARAGLRTELRAAELRVVGPPGRRVRTDGARQSGLLAALVRGDRAELPPELVALLRRTGTWHLVSVSGLHIGLSAAVAAGFAWVLLRPLARLGFGAAPRWLAALAATAAAAAYAGWAGWPLPAQRSVVMVAVFGAARAAARDPDPADLLALAALGVCVTDPAAPGSLSFQLSFGAVAGGLLWAPRLTRLLPPDSARLSRWLLSALAGSVGATLGTLPIVAWRFGSLPRWGPLANLWAIPWIGSIATPAALIGQLLPGAPGTLALAVADAAIEVGLAGLALFDGDPLPVAVGPGGALVLGLAVLLPRLPAVALALAALALWPRTTAVEELRITVLAVGQGTATLVEMPDGRRMLVDAGPPGPDLGSALRRLGVPRLDLAWLSHAHPDHYGGFPSVAAALGLERVRALRLPVEGLAREDPWRAEPGVELLWPAADWVTDEENDRSLVLRICATRCVLLPGDVEAPAEARLALADIAADLVVVPHHGSDTSSTPAFAAAVRPSLAVVPVGFANRYGHPRARALSAWRGSRVLRTDRDGSLRIRLGEQVSVERLGEPRAWLLR